MLTTEELRVAALQASEKRGRWVAKRRIMWRWFAWANWTYVLPIIGLLALLTATVGFAVWHYVGSDQAYLQTLSWLQSKSGEFNASVTPQNASLDAAAAAPTANQLIPATVSLATPPLAASLKLSLQLSTLKTETESAKP